MRVAFILLCLFSCHLCAQENSFPVISSRYQIYQVSGATIKLDTVTGESWHLQFANAEMKDRGVYYVWTAIPSYPLPNLTK
jgi:hypothetical protein